MHAKTLAGLSLVVLATAAGLAAVAADGAPATGTKTYTNTDLGVTSSATAPVFTNADLEKFGPPARTSTPRRETARMDDAEAWAFVQAALDREAVRLEEERRYALELEAARSMGLDEGCCDGGYGYLSAPFLRGFGFDHRRRAHPGRVPDPHETQPPLRSFISRRDTLHGRLPAGHGRFGRLKGEDVVPGPKGPGGHRSSGHGSGHSGRGSGQR